MKMLCKITKFDSFFFFFSFKTLVYFTGGEDACILVFTPLRGEKKNYLLGVKFNLRFS